MTNSIPRPDGATLTITLVEHGFQLDVDFGSSWESIDGVCRDFGGAIDVEQGAAAIFQFLRTLDKTLEGTPFTYQPADSSACQAGRNT